MELYNNNNIINFVECGKTIEAGQAKLTHIMYLGLCVHHERKHINLYYIYAASKLITHKPLSLLLCTVFI